MHTQYSSLFSLPCIIFKWKKSGKCVIKRKVSHTCIKKCQNVINVYAKWTCIQQGSLFPKYLGVALFSQNIVFQIIICLFNQVLYGTPKGKNLILHSLQIDNFIKITSGSIITREQPSLPSFWTYTQLQLSQLIFMVILSTVECKLLLWWIFFG